MPLSWEAFLLSLSMINPLQAALLIACVVLMQLGLVFATAQDDKLAYTSVPPSWRIWWRARTKHVLQPPLHLLMLTDP